MPSFRLPQHLALGCSSRPRPSFCQRKWHLQLAMLVQLPHGTELLHERRIQSQSARKRRSCRGRHATRTCQPLPQCLKLQRTTLGVGCCEPPDCTGSGGSDAGCFLRLPAWWKRYSAIPSARPSSTRQTAGAHVPSAPPPAQWYWTPSDGASTGGPWKSKKLRTYHFETSPGSVPVLGLGSAMKWWLASLRPHLQAGVGLHYFPWGSWSTAAQVHQILTKLVSWHQKVRWGFVEIQPCKQYPAGPMYKCFA